MSPIYVDLDFTLAYPVYKDDEHTQLSRIVFRPGAEEFLGALSKFGELVLLTASVEGWAEDVLSRRPKLRKFFSTLIVGEDLSPVAEQVRAVFGLEGVSHSEKLDMLGMIHPIAPAGVIFDDQAYGSSAWFVKSCAVGTYSKGPELWIRVDAFSRGTPDSSGLERAFHRFKHRNDRWQGRVQNPMELSGGAGYNPVTASF